jgi:hypothetical protein
VTRWINVTRGRQASSASGLAEHAHATTSAVDSGAFDRFLSQNGGALNNLSAQTFVTAVKTKAFVIGLSNNLQRQQKS